MKLVTYQGLKSGRESDVLIISGHKLRRGKGELVSDTVARQLERNENVKVKVQDDPADAPKPRRSRSRTANADPDTTTDDDAGNGDTD